MSATLEWQDMAARLALTVLAGMLFGINRSERGRAAGLATTVLVCLAASVSMIQANLLLLTAGKPHDSFITLDLMRLPLGVLTGMGFIGGGVILHRGQIIRGVTTAATLWLVTAIGLCFGGGQVVLGLATSLLGLGALWGLKKLEVRIGQDRRAKLILRCANDGPTEEEVCDLLQAEGYHIIASDATYHTEASAPSRLLRYEVEWHGGRGDVHPPAALARLARHPGVRKLRWKT